MRFDVALNISPDADLRNDPGDSIWVDIGLPRAGSVWHNMPKIVVKMKANPLFDGVRVLPPNFVQNGNVIDGWVYGDSTVGASGGFIANRYNFDLPDSTSSSPATSSTTTSRRRTTCTAMSAWRSCRPTPPASASSRASGRMAATAPSSCARCRRCSTRPAISRAILFWNDFANRGGENEWYFALGNLGYREQIDYDVYYTNGPSSGVGNGLGGRATHQTLAGYDILLYTCGDLGAYTISNGDYYNDPSNDIGVLSAWFQQGGKKAFLTGDDLVFSLTNSGSAALAFRNQYFGVQLHQRQPPAAHQQSDRAAGGPAGRRQQCLHDAGEPGPPTAAALGINDFDAIEPQGTASDWRSS